MVEKKIIIFRDGPTIDAIDNITGEIEYSGTDFATVVNGAIDTLINGGNIFIKNGTYFINRKLTPINYLTIEGESSSRTILKASSSLNDTILGYSGSSDLKEFTVKNIMFDGNKDSQTRGNIIDISHPSRCVFDRVNILNAKDIGLFLQLQPNIALGSTIINSYIYYSGSHNVSIGVSDFSIINSVIAWASQINCLITGGFGRIIGNHLGGGINCLKLDTASEVIVSNNVLEQAKQHGINVASGYGCMITSNIVRNSGQSSSNTYNGIDINGSSIGNIVAINRCSDNQKNRTQKYGIRESDASNFNMIIGNYVRGNLIGGIPNIGTNTIVVHNKDWNISANILSDKFSIDSVGIKTVIMTHSLDIIPAIQDCYLTVVQNTVVDDWEFNLLKIVSTDAINITAKINVSKMSATVGASARLALRVGKP